MKGEYKYEYDTKNIKLHAEDFNKIKAVQDVLKSKLKCFITMGDVIKLLIQQDETAISIYKSLEG